MSGSGATAMAEPADAKTGVGQGTRPGEKVLLIKAKGGLGNRMLSAITGLIYADLTGRRAIIDWRDGVYAPRGENAYPRLFDAPYEMDPGAYDDVAETVPAIWGGALDQHPVDMVSTHDPTKHSSPFIYRKYCVPLWRLERETDVAVFWCYLPKTLRLQRHLVGDARFQNRSVESVITEYLTRYFTPNARVRGAVESFLAGLSRPRIGVHIRYTDRKIPLAPIRDALKAARAELPDAPVFLATDNATIQGEFAAEFDNLHFTEKWLPEDGAHLHLGGEGVDLALEAENAMIDMWALAGCDRLIYSKNSTFSIASALIGGIPEAQQTDIDARNWKIVAKRAFQAVA